MDDAKPLILKLGVSLIVPLAAYLASDVRFRNNSNKQPTGNRYNLPATYDRGLKDALQDHKNCVTRILHGAFATPATNPTVPTSTETGITCEKSPFSEALDEGLLSPETERTSDLSCYPAIKCPCDEDDSLEEVHQQPDQESANSVAMTETTADSRLTAELDNKKFEEEQEIVLQSLWEMDALIQIQMLEFHDRQEQDDAVRDLENRLHASAVEVERLLAQIESLQNENQMLNLQASQLLVNMDELESEKAKAKQLRMKLKSVRTQARGRMGSLEQTISELQEKLQKMARDEEENRSKLERLRGLEVEVSELRTRNFNLSQENFGLARRLESAQTAAIYCTLEASQVKVHEETNQLREASGKFNKKIEQLEADHFGDEEFMYLRWLSGQLRHETKEHIPWNMAEKDLSRSTSSESENKAVELVFDRANEFTNSECCHSPKGRNSACNVTTIDKPLKRDEGSQKPKFFRKFKKLVTRKSGENNRVSPVVVHEHPSRCDPPEGRCSASSCSIDDAPKRYSSDSMSSSLAMENSIRGAQLHDDDKWQNRSAWIQASYKSPLDVTRAKTSIAEDNNRVAHCNSDLGASRKFTRMGNRGGKLTLMDLLPNIMSM